MKNYEEMTVYERKGYLIKKLDEIKSVFSGREKSLDEYTHEGYTYSDEKCDRFIQQMINIYTDYYKEKNQQIKEDFIDFCTSFIKISIMICLIQCRKSDYVFESIIKFANVAYKPQNGGKSVFDILVGDVNEKKVSGIEFTSEKRILNENYEKFNILYDNCYNVDFEGEIRIMVNKFLESEKYDLFTDINQFEQALRILSIDIRHLKNIKREIEDSRNE